MQLYVLSCGQDVRDSEKIPIGNAFPGRKVFLLDEEDHEIAAFGRQGEICVAGESLAQGYYRNEEQTKKQFVMYPVSGGEPQRIYRPGIWDIMTKKEGLYLQGEKTSRSSIWDTGSSLKRLRVP